MFIILKWITAALSAITIFSFFATSTWLFELLSHFRLHYALGFSMLTLLFMISNHKTSAIFALAFTLANIMPAWNMLYARPKPAPLINPLTLISTNINHKNNDLAHFNHWILTESPSILVILELTSAQLATIDQSLPQYPFRVIETRDDGFGIGMFSQIPFEDSEIRRLGNSDSPVAYARIQHMGKSLQLIGLHLWSPESNEGIRRRNHQLIALKAQLQTETDENFIIIGDFNLTPWSPYFQQLFTNAPIKWARPTLQQMASWPAPLGMFGIPIDHCLLSPGLMARYVERGPNIGSDHYPLRVEISFNP